MKAYRKLLADKVLTLGILSIVSLIFGQLIAKEKAVDWSLVLLAVTTQVVRFTVQGSRLGS